MIPVTIGGRELIDGVIIESDCPLLLIKSDINNMGMEFDMDTDTATSFEDKLQLETQVPGTNALNFSSVRHKVDTNVRVKYCASFWLFRSRCRNTDLLVFLPRSLLKYQT